MAKKIKLKLDSEEYHEIIRAASQIDKPEEEALVLGARVINAYYERSDKEFEEFMRLMAKKS